MSNRIYLKGAGRQEETTAASTITPGDLIALNSAGKVAVHGTEGAAAERAFALEDALQGKTISDDYSADDIVTFILAQPGDVVYAFIKAGENISIGDVLISAGDGTLIAEGSAASATVIEQRIGVALEAIDLSGSGAVDTRISVRVI